MDKNYEKRYDMKILPMLVWAEPLQLDDQLPKDQQDVDWAA